MARLIDATRIEQFILNNCSDNEEINTIYGELINASTIDIVRCGECKKVDTFMCPMFSAGWGYTDEDFCSEGERRSE